MGRGFVLSVGFLGSEGRIWRVICAEGWLFYSTLFYFYKEQYRQLSEENLFRLLRGADAPAPT